MKGTTLIQALIQGAEGRLLWESFEGLNWGQDQGWTTTQGSPITSTDTAEEGLKSLKMSASPASDTYPQIEKAITSPEFNLMIGYFFDDAAETASAFEPFLEAMRGATTYALGVDNGTSTTHYTVNNAGAKSATSVARTSAWHRFLFIQDGTNYILKIDGTTVLTTASSNNSWNKVRLGSTNATGTAFGYFDYIQVATGYKLTVRGLEVGQKVSMFDSDDVQIGSTQTAAGASVTIDVTAEDQPMNAYLKITRIDGFNPRFLSATQEMFAGDIWPLVVVGFDRRATGLDPRRNVRRDDQEANSGKSQSVFFNARDEIVMAINEITEDQRYQVLVWWSWAQRLLPYSVAIDSNQMYNGILQAAIAPGDTTASVDDAAGIAAGSRMILRRTDNLNAEEVGVLSVSGTTITFDSPVVFAYRANDWLRSIRYWPFSLSQDKNLNVTLASLRDKRWNFGHRFKEDL